MKRIRYILALQSPEVRTLTRASAKLSALGSNLPRADVHTCQARRELTQQTLAAMEEEDVDEDFADALEDFARTPLAEPAREIDGLFAAAGALARERGR